MPSLEGIDDNVPPKGYGVYGESRKGGYGVQGFSEISSGVRGESNTSNGVYGSGGVCGVLGESYEGIAVRGESTISYGMFGRSNSGVGVYGESNSLSGVSGFSNNYHGVSGFSNLSDAVVGETPGSGVAGVVGKGDNGYGVIGESVGGTGAYGVSQSGTGVYAYSSTGYGLDAHSDTSYGLYARGNTGLAALLDGNVEITGNLTISGTLQKGGGSFKIDHPLDPANKYLSHSFVESPDMKNVYDGVVTLDDKGEAEIELPDWFGALNKDFRYQLTAIGAPGPNLYISEEISSDGVSTTNYSRTSSNKNKSKINSRFKIAGGASDMKVSWQVTGIRKDPWANAHRILVEEDKPAKERGYYTYPELYGQPEERGIIRRLLVPEIERKSRCS